MRSWSFTSTFGKIGLAVLFAVAACGDPGDTLAEGSQTNTESQQTSTLSRTDIEKIVHEYIVSNPNVIVEAFDELEKREMADKQKLFEDNLVKSKNDLWNDGYSFVAGNPDADVTIVEFFDYNCGYCRKALPTVLSLLESDKNIRVIFKEWPIQGPDSVVAAKASIAAAKQGKFLELHEALMGSSDAVEEASIMKAAADVGIDVVQLQKDMKAPEADEVLGRNSALARSLGITGTPAFIVGDQLIPGAAPLDQFKAVIDEVRTSCKIC